MTAPSKKTAISGEKAVPVVNVVRPGYARGVPIPWQLKMGIKIALSSMPVPYSFWARLGIFKHGDLGTELPTLQKSFTEHVTFYQERTGKVPEWSLELGPGDSLGHALSAKAAGAGSVWFVDVGDYATKDPNHYRAFCEYLKLDGMPDFSREEVLAFTGSRYGTEGLKSMAEIPTERIDFSYSHAVLEHIRRNDFAGYMKELFRVHKPGSIARHWVDLHDHLGGALNSFRFSPMFWEGKAVGRAGFYTNRLTMAEMIGLAEEAGFKVEIQRISKWEKLPTPHSAMDIAFNGKTEEELNICTFLMVLIRP